MPALEPPLHVALFTDSYPPTINGVVTSVLGLKRGLEEMGHHVTVVAPRHPQQVLEPSVIRLRSTTYRPQPEQRYVFPPSLRKMLEFRKLKFDVIHTHGMLMPFIGLGVGRVLGVPVVHTYHTRIQDYVHYAPFYASMAWMTDDRRWYVRGSKLRTGVTTNLNRRYTTNTKALAARVDAWFCNRCLEVIAPAEPIAEEILELGVTTQVRVVHNGIDLAKLEPPQPDPFVKFDVTKDMPRLLTVCRLGKEKSVDELLRRFKLIHDHAPKARLIVLGDGPEREPLEALALSLGMSDAVLFRGYVAPHEIAAYYQHATAFVFASLSEVHPMVGLEAAACGLPIVARAKNGITKCVLDNQTGYLIDPEDPRVFADRVLEIIDKPELRQRLSETSSAWARREWGHLRMSQKVLAVYTDAILEFEGWSELTLPEAYELARSDVGADVGRFE
jgi:1,2-diacylglycerol 3-alpha-glucosyltransferase